MLDVMNGILRVIFKLVLSCLISEDYTERMYDLNRPAEQVRACDNAIIDTNPVGNLICCEEC